MPRRSKEDKNKLKKLEISTPVDFRHVGHVSYDPKTGFDLKRLDPHLKALFETAGVSKKQLRDRNTATFIYDFIERNGGLEAVKRLSTTPQDHRGAERPAVQPLPPPTRAHHSASRGQAPVPPNVTDAQRPPPSVPDIHGSKPTPSYASRPSPDKHQATMGPPRPPSRGPSPQALLQHPADGSPQSPSDSPIPPPRRSRGPSPRPPSRGTSPRPPSRGTAQCPEQSTMRRAAPPPPPPRSTLPPEAGRTPPPPPPPPPQAFSGGSPPPPTPPPPPFPCSEGPPRSPSPRGPLPPPPSPLTSVGPMPPSPRGPLPPPPYPLTGGSPMPPSPRGPLPPPPSPLTGGGPPPPPPPPPLPSAGGPPPPPPPPPPPGGPPHPLPPMTGGVQSAPSAGRDDLFNQIRQAGNREGLNRVETRDRPENRDDLMDQIKAGANLKKVRPSTRERPKQLDSNPLAAALRKALEARAKKLHDEMSDEGDEWSD